jgi:hypothetical protein
MKTIRIGNLWFEGIRSLGQPHRVFVTVREREDGGPIVGELRTIHQSDWLALVEASKQLEKP